MRRASIIGIFAVGLVITILLSLAQGSVTMSVSEVWQALWQQGPSLNQTILWELRLPRIAAALLVGAALGMSGALLQGMLRNGLADPFILGISAGAGLVAISLITLNIFLGWLPIAAPPVNFSGFSYSAMI